MPDNRVQAGLLLRQDARAARDRAVARFGHRGRLSVYRQVFSRCEHFVQFFRIGLGVGFRPTERFLHVAGARFAAVFVIAIGAESQPHRLDIIADLRWLDRFSHLDAQLRVVAQTARAVHVELAVLACDKAEVAEGGVGDVGGRVGKAHLELTRHLFRLEEVQQIVARGLCPRQHVEILVRLHTGQRRAHDIAGIVAAAAQGDDTRVERLLDQLAHGILTEVMQLDGLAGGEVRALDAVLADGLCHKGELIARDAACGHTQAQHAGLAALLGVAAIVAGKTFVFADFDLAGVERGRFVAEFAEIGLPCLDRNGIHAFPP